MSSYQIIIESSSSGFMVFPLYGFFSAHGALVLGCPSSCPGALTVLPPPAHGAAVPAPGGGSLPAPVPGGSLFTPPAAGGGALVLFAHGARVGWFGPAGTFGPAAFAHGAAVIGIPPAAAPAPPPPTAPAPIPASGSLSGGCALDGGARISSPASGSLKAVCGPGTGPVCRAVGAEFDGVTAFGCEDVCTLA